MYFDDHGFPHFHARDASGQAKIRIDEVEVIDNAMQTRQLRLVLAWAELHQSGAVGAIGSGREAGAEHFWRSSSFDDWTDP